MPRVLPVQPAVNQWVVVVAEQGERQARQSLVRRSPALTTAVHEPGLVTVIYPNALVLQHGFKGKAVFHVTVPVARLRLWKGSAVEKQRLDDALLHAVKSRSCWLDARPAPVAQGGRDRSRSRDRDAARAGGGARREEEEEVAASRGPGEEEEEEEVAASRGPPPSQLEDDPEADETTGAFREEAAAPRAEPDLRLPQASDHDAAAPSASAEVEMEVERPAAEEDEEDAAPSAEAGVGAAEAPGGGAAPSVAAEAAAELPAAEELAEAALEATTPPRSRGSRTERRALASTPEHSQIEHSHIARRGRKQSHSKRPYWLPRFTSMASQAFRDAGHERMLVSKMEGLLTSEVFSKAEFEEGLWHLVQDNKVCRFDDVLFIV